MKVSFVFELDRGLRNCEKLQFIGVFTPEGHIAPSGHISREAHIARCQAKSAFL